MKKIFLFITLLIGGLCFFSISAFAASMYYSTSGVAHNKNIEVSTSVLNSANDSCTKNTSKFSYTATISSEYDLHIYHFEAPYQGYYSFHTTGNTDTVMKVYEQQNFLWWTTRYVDHGLVDDGSMADSYSLNSNVVLCLDKGEDYFVCVRAYSTKTGSYTLNVEPNEDKMLRSIYKYNTWDCDYLCNSSAISKYWTTSKQYLTKEEVVFFYWSLDPACQEYVYEKLGYDFEYVYNEYNENIANGISIANDIIGLLLSIPGVPTSYGITASILGSVLEYAYETSTNDKYEMMNLLVDECGVKYNDSGWSSTDGLLIVNKFNGNALFTNSTYYYANNDDLLTGDSYEKGSWIK